MNLEHILKENGFRNTKEREKIFSFSQNNHLFTASDIEKNFPEIGRASVFRTIKFFSQLGIIRKIFLGNNAEYYEFNEKKHHHEHIKCEACGKISSFEIPDICKKIVSTAQKQGFSVKTHSINIIGICNNCK